MVSPLAIRALIAPGGNGVAPVRLRLLGRVRQAEIGHEGKISPAGYWNRTPALVPVAMMYCRALPYSSAVFRCSCISGTSAGNDARRRK